MRSTFARAPLASMLLALALACRPSETPSNPELQAAAQDDSLWVVHEKLETLIDEESDSERDREYAYKQAQRSHDDGTAQWAFARAAITGRLAEAKGLKALWLIKEVEKYARLSMDREPAFRDAAAKRMLGTLYVLAGDHVEHGDSEVGLGMLESLYDADGANPHNQLRLAEGYISLGDPDPALEILCLADEQRDQLSPDEQRLLDRLFQDVGGRELVGCG